MPTQTDFDKLSELLGQPNARQFARTFNLPHMTLYEAKDGTSASFPRFLMKLAIAALRKLPESKRKKIIQDLTP